MDLSDPDELIALRERLGEMFTGRRVICAGGPLAAYTEMVRTLALCRAATPLLLASGPGAGPTPPEGSAEVVMLEFQTHDEMSEELSALDAMLRDLSAEVRRRIEEYDGQGEALWWVPPFVRTDPILGRTVAGGRPLGWALLEDKVIVDALWDAVGQPRAPSCVVPCDAEALSDAASRLDDGDGTVWVGDGFNGGGERVRWVRTEAEAEAALAYFAGRAGRLRVMPFLEGVPCSIHGIVLPDGTAAFRPVELAILRDAGHRFVYGGQGTTWSPPEADREEMRALVRRTGEHLRRSHGYRGAFGIDGIMTRDGFRPTELNPRFSGGIGAMARATEPVLLTLLQLNLVAGRDPGVGARELEQWLLPQFDAQRFCRALAMIHEPVLDSPLELKVSWDGSSLHRNDTGDWLVEAAPTSGGVYARLNAPVDELTGVRVGELNAELMRLLDAELGSSFGEVAAAPDVRVEVSH